MNPGDDQAKFEAACKKMSEGFDEKEKVIYQIILGAAFNTKMPDDLKIELIERALHLYKLFCAFNVVTIVPDLFNEDLDLVELRQRLARFARVLGEIGDNIERSIELLCASTEVTQEILKTS